MFEYLVKRGGKVLWRDRKLEQPSGRGKKNLVRHHVPSYQEPVTLADVDRRQLMKKLSGRSGALATILAAKGPYYYADLPIETPKVLMERMTFPCGQKPVIVKKVRPAFPSTGVVFRKEGSILLSVHLQADGRISNLKVVRGIEDGRFEFETAAMLAVRRWQFKPAQCQGKAVTTRMQLEIKFRIRN